MDTRTLTAASHRVYCAALHCLCQQSRVCKARYTKSVESCSRASEFICIHSTACLSSEPILITSSSGLLQQCTSSHPLSLEEEKRAAAGAFLLLWYYSFSSLRGCSSYWFVCCQARLLSSILLSESEEKQWPDLCAHSSSISCSCCDWFGTEGDAACSYIRETMAGRIPRLVKDECVQ